MRNKSYKIIVSVLVVCFFSLHTMGQAKPYFNQYLLNNYIINPAITGIENYTDIRASYKKQWVGIDGAPTTQYVTVHTPIGKNDSRTNPNSFFVRGGNDNDIIAGEQSGEDVTAHHGVGLMFLNDKAGYISRMNFSGSYAYHLPLGRRFMISAGISAGLSKFSVDATKSNLATTGQNPNDPALGSSSFYYQLNKNLLELGTGIYVYSPYMYAGFSVLNIVPSKKNSFGIDEGTSFTPNYIATAGVKFVLNDDFYLTPSAMLQYWQPSLKCLNMSAKLQYLDLAWIGANYRSSDAVGGYAAMAGFNVANTFNFSYCYEMSPNSELQNFTKATHEVMFGIILGNNYSNIFRRNNP